VVKVFKGTKLAAIHRKRITISKHDMKLVRRFMEQQWDD